MVIRFRHGWAAVTEQGVGPSSWSAHQAGDRWDLLQQWQELSDIVTVPAGQRDGERDALAVDDDVVLAARTCVAVDRARPTFWAASDGPDMGGVDHRLTGRTQARV